MFSGLNHLLQYFCDKAQTQISSIAHINNPITTSTTVLYKGGQSCEYSLFSNRNIRCILWHFGGTLKVLEMKLYSTKEK